MITHCVRDRDLLIEEIRILRPEFAKAQPSKLLRAVLRSICGFRVAPRSLFPGQLALCDFQSKIVHYAAAMKNFVNRETSLEGLINSTLAHELGHIRLHANEIRNRYTRSFELPGGGVIHADGRNVQREQEAELYAAIFLVPKKLLVEEHSAKRLYEWHQNETWKKPPVIWRLVVKLAAKFEVSPSLMKRCLCELGWISSEYLGNGIWDLKICSPKSDLEVQAAVDGIRPGKVKERS
jgi:hypothetical protein